MQKQADGQWLLQTFRLAAILALFLPRGALNMPARFDEFRSGRVFRILCHYQSHRDRTSLAVLRVVQSAYYMFVLYPTIDTELTAYWVGTIKMESIRRVFSMRGIKVEGFDEPICPAVTLTCCL